ncbi:MAG: hypothetical protein GY832_21210 [Chloroflexi bacterium]|nr:hypothetical protein [Chloroflexota bacterium]
MGRKLAMIGGVCQVLFGLFHLLLSTQIQSLQSVSPDVRATMQALNIGSAMLLFFCAYISFFHRDELVSTRLGKGTSAFIMLFYLVRAVEEIILFTFSPVIFVLCLAVGGIYLGILILSTRGSVSLNNIRGDS